MLEQKLTSFLLTVLVLGTLFIVTWLLTVTIWEIVETIRSFFI